MRNVPVDDESGSGGGEVGDVVRFGPFRFDRATGELWRGSEPVPLQPQPARVLAALLEQPGILVTRRALVDLIWGDRFAETELGLNYCIRQVRLALGDAADASVYVETLRGRGYRFRAPAPPVIATRPRALMAARSWLVAIAAGIGAIIAIFSRDPGAGRAAGVDAPVPVTIASFTNLTGVANCTRITAIVLAALEHELSGLERGQVRLVRDEAASGPDGYLVSGVIREDREKRWVTVYVIRARDGKVTWSGSLRTTALSAPALRTAFVRRMIDAIPS